MMCKTFTDDSKLLKFLLISLLLIGVSLLSMLAPVPSIAVKPLKLDEADVVPIPAQVSGRLFDISNGASNLIPVSDQF